MNKKLIVLLVVGLLTIVSAYGTYAWFTSQATSTGNVFVTGTLNISGPGQITTDLSVDNIYPSWTTSKTVTVKNNGSIPFKYRLSVLPLIGNLLYDGPTPLQIKINSGNFVNINQLGTVDLGILNTKNQSGDSAQITFEFKLPPEADNAYQGVTGNFTFLFDATQTNENATYNGIVATNFGYGQWSGVKGYDVGFNLVGLQAKDLSSAEVSLYKDGLLLAQNTSKDIQTLYPTATSLSSPFDIDGIIEGGNLDTSWNYGPWLAGHQADVPNKAVIKVTTKDGMTYTAVNTNCSPAGPSVP